MKCVFFDRDGIVNRHPGPGYVERWEDFHLLPEFVEALRLARQRGYAAVVVSNQRGVALGVMSAATVDDMHRRLRAVLKERHQLELLDILYCPHDRDACECRKPKPGMLLEAARRHGIDLRQSWMVGDSPKDAEAGKAAGCRTVLVSAEETSPCADYRIDAMSALPALLARLLDVG
jgi:histidinol-phosphate phosphatase family protein